MSEMVRRAIAELRPHERNYNKHGDRQVDDLSLSLQRFGQRKPVVTWRDTIVAGHGLTMAAQLLGWTEILTMPVPDAWDEATVLAYLAADNELARQADPDLAQLAAIAKELEGIDAELARLAAGGDEALKELLATLESESAGSGDGDAQPQMDRAEELRQKWQTEEGQIWQIGPHFAICGDCRNVEDWKRLLAAAGVSKVNGVFTSPPYAEQRKDQYGGVPTDQYVDWWELVQSNVKANLAQDGSFFVNIKAHCEDGQRVLYCMDLVCAMVRRWEWRFVDELCWKRQGVPGKWSNRFKNGFEPIYHFSTGDSILFIPEHVMHESQAAFTYTGKEKKAKTGSGFFQGNTVNAGDGMAYPSNVVDVPAGNMDGDVDTHSAAFPIALPDFFIRAYSDPGDVWLDTFLGSGTTIVAAHNNKRIGLGIEKLPKYLAVILERLQEVVGESPKLLNG